ncbi:MAG TPA: hypothetical protein VMB52_03205 [Verrucomicrobiae bacterium]|nr:hypothetical protein [Verrucomicrobiae bacterium]
MPGFQKTTLGLLLVTSLVVIVWVGYFIGKQNLSGDELVLSNLLLVLFSTLASTIVTHFYFEASNKRSLGMYAKKAAEKVSNLSSQLSKLSLYLQQEDDDSGLTPEEILLVKNERLRGAIHIVETLQSVNDRSLSDWRGIVPDEDIQEARQLIENQEDRFKQLVDEVHDVLDQSASYTEDDDDDSLHQDINSLKKQIEKLATSVIGTPIKGRSQKEEVLLRCPSCGAINEYRQRPKIKSKKQFKCEACYTPLLSSWSQAGGFKLTVDESPPSPVDRADIDEKLITEVKNLLPEQPWPKGISKEIQKQVGIRGGMMQRIIYTLIARGDFKPQKDGRLYELVNTNPTAQNGPRQTLD